MNITFCVIASLMPFPSRNRLSLILNWEIHCLAIERNFTTCKKTFFYKKRKKNLKEPIKITANSFYAKFWIIACVDPTCVLLATLQFMQY